MHINKTYIVTKRFKGKSISKELVNIPYGTKLNTIQIKDNAFIVYNNNPICLVTSQIAYDHFSQNDDGKGLERGKLVQSIKKTLEKKDAKHQDRWDKFWNDTICQKYKKKEHDDHWLWNYDFYNADIFDLNHIMKLI